MKPKSFSFTAAALAFVGLTALSTSCSKSIKSLDSPQLSPITASDPQLPSIPYGTSTGEGYAEVWDKVINGATTSVEVTEWQAFVYGERNQIEIAVEPGYVMVGGGAQTVDPNGNPANVDAVLTAAYPVNDGTFSTYVAANKDHGGIFYYSDLYVYVIGIKLLSGGTAIPTSAITPHLTLQDAESISANHPTYTIGVPAGNVNRILSGGALDDYGSGYGNLLVENDWTSNSSTASGKDQKEADPSQIWDYCLSIDNNYISGFGYLNVTNYTGLNDVTTRLSTVAITVPSGWGITGVGGKSTYTGYGRLLYNMYAPSTSQVIISTKDQDVQDISGTVSGIVSAIQPAQ